VKNAAFAFSYINTTDNDKGSSLKVLYTWGLRNLYTENVLISKHEFVSNTWKYFLYYLHNNSHSSGNLNGEYF